MSERNWFYVIGDVRQGPIAESGLRERIASGSIPAATPVWTETMAQWQPAGTLPEFAALFPQPASVPPPLPGLIAPIDYASPPPMRVREGLGDDAGMRLLLPVGRSGWAIASGYLGLLSVIPVIGVFAVITGIIAINHMRRDQKLHGMVRAIFGLVMGGGFSMLYGLLWLRVFLRHHHHW